MFVSGQLVLLRDKCEDATTLLGLINEDNYHGTIAVVGTRGSEVLLGLDIDDEKHKELHNALWRGALDNTNGVSRAMKEKYSDKRHCWYVQSRSVLPLKNED